MMQRNGKCLEYWQMKKSRRSLVGMNPVDRLWEADIVKRMVSVSKTVEEGNTVRSEMCPQKAMWAPTC